jgi:hypothetical protein
MAAIIGMIPWEVVGTWLVTHAIEYAIAKNKKIKANSLYEAVGNVSRAGIQEYKRRRNV